MRMTVFATAMAASLVTAGEACAQALSPKVDTQPVDAAWSEPSRIQELSTNQSIVFVPPHESEIPDNEFGRSVREGLAIFTNTHVLAKDYVGDGLRCSNCHLDAGRRGGAAPMWGAWVKYPQFRSKNHRVNTIGLRIQGCFRFSMNGTPPPEDGDIMTALQSYMFWLARFAPTGGKLKGTGFPAIAAPPLAPSIERGKAVFEQKCAACHNTNGQGRKVADATGYQFPPLWGPDSFNWGAGMASVNTAAAFIKANMPFGLRYALTDQEAWDVAMYIDSRPRPQDPRFTGDLAGTRKKFHSGKWSLYGTEQDGELLGDPRTYPLKAPTD